MPTISQIELNGHTYDIKDTTHILELPIDLKQDNNSYGVISRNNIYPYVWLKNPNLTLTNPGADFGYSDAQGDFIGTNYFGDSESNWLGRVGGVINPVSSGDSNRRTRLNLAAQTYTANGTTFRNNFNIDVDADGKCYYWIQDAAAFRRDISSNDCFKTASFNTSLPTGNDGQKMLTSITLPRGKWIIMGGAQFQSNSTGVRTLKIITGADTAISTTPIPGTAQCPALSTSTNITATVLLNVTTDGTVVKLVGWQNSGSNLAVTGEMRAALI